MPHVTFLLPESRSGEVEVNTSLLEASKAARVSVEPRLWRECFMHHLSGRSADGRREPV